MIAAFALAAALSACADYNDPYYVHSVWRPADAADSRVSVFFLTDRAADPDLKPDLFDYRSGNTPSCGVLQAGIPAARVPTGPAIFAKEAGQRQVLGCGRAQNDLASAIAQDARAKNCNAVLVFVHGFDTGFETAALRAAQLAADTQWRCAVAAFSWSSAGKAEAYAQDQASSLKAEPLFREFLRALAGEGLKTDIVAHSMGAQLVLDTLASDVTADQVILAAPDVGDGELAAHFHRLTIYASDEDAVLALSRRVHDGTARLGHEPHRTFSNGNIDVIDASDVPGDFMGHNYYGLSHEIIADMSLALAGVPVEARLQPRGDTPPTLLPGNRLNVSWNRRPDLLTRLVRWLVTAFSD